MKKEYRVTLSSYSESVSFPIDLTPTELKLLQDIENYCAARNTRIILRVGEEK